jgi:hypothetical protein
VAEFFEALGLVAVVVVVGLAVGVALTMRALIRANRVAPGRRSAAPLSWLVSPRASARLHRRLRRAAGVADVAVVSLAPAAVTLRDVAGELVARATTIDDWLVAAQGLHPVARRSRLAQLSAEVHEVEGSAARLHQLSCDWRRCLDEATAGRGLALPTLDQRLDSVEAALRELAVPRGSASPSPAPAVGRQR